MEPRRISSEPGVATRGSLRLRLASGGQAPGTPVVVSIRPHEIELVVSERGAPAGANVLGGTVQRMSYLGDAVDYQILVNGSDVVLRVTAPPPARLGPGDTVTLTVAPEACVSTVPTKVARHDLRGRSTLSAGASWPGQRRVIEERPG